MHVTIRPKALQEKPNNPELRSQPQQEKQIAPNHKSITSLLPSFEASMALKSSVGLTFGNNHRNKYDDPTYMHKLERYVDSRRQADERQKLIGRIKAGVLGTLVGAGLLVSAPHVARMGRMIEEHGALLESPECVVSSIKNQRLQIPIPDDLQADVKFMQQYAPQGQNCISPKAIEMYRREQRLRQEIDMYMHLDPAQLNTFKEMSQYAPSYLELDGNGNTKSIIYFMQEGVEVPSTNEPNAEKIHLPPGTIYVQTYVPIEVNGQDKIKISVNAFVNPEDGFIYNYLPNLELYTANLEELRNGARTINEKVGQLVGQYANKCDTLIPDGSASEFFRLKESDMHLLDVQLMQNAQSPVLTDSGQPVRSIMFTDQNGYAKGILADYPEVEQNFTLNTFERFMDGLMSKVEYLYFPIEGQYAPQPNQQLDASQLNVDSIVFISKGGFIFELSEEMLESLTNKEHQDYMKRVIQLRLELEQMAYQAVASNDQQFLELTSNEAENSIVSRSMDLPEYVEQFNELHPTKVFELKKTFVNKTQAITLHDETGAPSMRLERQVDFNSKEASYIFTLHGGAQNGYQGTIASDGTIAFTNPPPPPPPPEPTLQQRVTSLIPGVDTMPKPEPSPVNEADYAAVKNRTESIITSIANGQTGRLVLERLENNCEALDLYN